MRLLLLGTSQKGLKPSERVDIEAPASPKKETPEVDSSANQSKGAPSGPAVVPVRVFRDETVYSQSFADVLGAQQYFSEVKSVMPTMAVQEIGVQLGTNPDGDLQFTVTDTVEEAQDAARALQVVISACLARSQIGLNVLNLCSMLPVCHLQWLPINVEEANNYLEMCIQDPPYILAG